MITKEQFISIMDKLKKQHDYDRNFTRLMGEAFPDTHPPIYDNSKVEEAAIKALELHFDGDDTIEWWIYETNFGEKNLCIVEDEKELYFKSSEELYDYLAKDKLRAKRLQRYVYQIKAGGKPTLFGVELSTELYEELLAYVKDEDYRKILKSRVSKK